MKRNGEMTVTVLSAATPGRRMETRHFVPESGDGQERVNAQGVRRVAAYCRVSTITEEQELSFETQCDYYQRTIDADPSMTLVGVYGDQGISGVFMAKRPEFQRLMQDCRDGRIDLILTKSISRFARNLGDCAEAIRQLRALRIPVIFEKEGINSMDEHCGMVLSLLASMAQEEVNSLSQNIRWALEKRNESGNPTRVPAYGFRRTAKGEWVICEAEAKRVRLAFRMANDEASYTDIRAALDRLEAKEGTDITWPQSRLRALLLNEVYMGDILTNKRFTTDYLSKRSIKNTGQRPQFYLEGHHPAIVSKEVFEHVGALVKSGALNTKFDHKAHREKEGQQ